MIVYLKALYVDVRSGEYTMSKLLRLFINRDLLYVNCSRQFGLMN